MSNKKKICTKCHKSKPISDYPVDKYGTNSWCQECIDEFCNQIGS